MLACLAIDLKSCYTAMNKTKNHPRPRLVEIKKYANRRLYDITHSGYITLADLANLIASGQMVCVTDAKTGDDITAATLLQIMLEMENEGHGLLSVATLSRLIIHASKAEADFVMIAIERALDRLDSHHHLINHQSHKSDTDKAKTANQTDLDNLAESFDALAKAFQQFQKNT